MQTIGDPPLEIPVIDSVDLFVVVGGMTGITAGRLVEEGVSTAEPIPDKEE